MRAQVGLNSGAKPSSNCSGYFSYPESLYAHNFLRIKMYVCVCYNLSLFEIIYVIEILSVLLKGGFAEYKFKTIDVISVK